MPIIKTVDPKDATGEVKDNYAIFDELGIVPTPFRMFSASPALQSLRVPVMQYFRNHPNLSPGLLALVRMLVAEELGYPYCVSFNRTLIKMLGIADDDNLGRILADPDLAPLSDKDKAMLKFVLKALKTPDEVSAGDMDEMRGLGWSDQDIFEACMHGADMIVHGTLFKAFKMGEGETC